MADQQPDVISTEKETFKKQVDLFVAHHRQKQRKKEAENKRNDYSLEEVIERAPLLSDDSVAFLLDKGQDYPVSVKVVNEVKTALKRMQITINRMDPRRRFFILDTVNFFSSKIGIGKLIPALLILNGDDQKKAVAEFVLQTYLSIQKNVETLIDSKEIFDKERLHMERGELYVIVADIARIIIKLFNKDFVREAGETLTAVEFLQTTFDPGSLKLNNPGKSGSEYIYQEIIDQEDEVRRIVLRFILTIQSHESLYTYSLKRYEYYKLFLARLTDRNRFKDVDPIDISKILAGCLVANDQLKPDDELIEKMIDEERFNTESVLSARQDFIDQLSPGHIYKLISRLRVSLQHISKTNFGEEFQDIQKFSVKTILKNIWTGFIGLVEKGLTMATEPFYVVFQQVKRTYESFIFDERQGEESVRSDMVQTAAPKSGRMKFISKNLDAFSQMSQHFKLVETTVVSFRGEQEGATFKDFGFNSHFFQKNEALMVKFLDTFKKLFSFLEKDKKVQVITYEGHRGIKEYYAAYSFAFYLFCFGLTHIKNPKLPVIEEKSIFPYIFVMMESRTKKSGRIENRGVKDKEDNRTFCEMNFTPDTAKLFYEPMYLILHLLPEYDWNDEDTQICVSFLRNELKRLQQQKQQLLYCDDEL